MKKSIICLIVLICFNLTYAQEFTLVETGKSKSSIIIPVKATAMEIKAARVLQDYIYRISGARVRIKSDQS